eukprot:403356011
MDTVQVKRANIHQEQGSPQVIVSYEGTQSKDGALWETINQCFLLKIPKESKSIKTQIDYGISSINGFQIVVLPRNQDVTVKSLSSRDYYVFYESQAFVRRNPRTKHLELYVFGYSKQQNRIDIFDIEYLKQFVAQ